MGKKQEAQPRAPALPRVAASGAASGRACDWAGQDRPTVACSPARRQHRAHGRTAARVAIKSATRSKAGRKSATRSKAGPRRLRMLQCHRRRGGGRRRQMGGSEDGDGPEAGFGVAAGRARGGVLGFWTALRPLSRLFVLIAHALSSLFFQSASNFLSPSLSLLSLSLSCQ